MFCQLRLRSEQVGRELNTRTFPDMMALSVSVCRSTTCVVVYLMLKYDWEALQALRHIRQARPVEVDII